MSFCSSNWPLVWRGFPRITPLNVLIGWGNELGILMFFVSFISVYSSAAANGQTLPLLPGASVTAENLIIWYWYQKWKADYENWLRRDCPLYKRWITSSPRGQSWKSSQGVGRSRPESKKKSWGFLFLKEQSKLYLQWQNHQKWCHATCLGSLHVSIIVQYLTLLCA
jgi:hypothetical protein